MTRLTLDHLIVAAILTLLFAFPTVMFRELDLLHHGEGIDLTEYDFSETRSYELELVWQKRFWQGPTLQIWVDDCLRSIVVNNHDISKDFSYCDWLGFKRIDLSPYLTSGPTALAIEVENLGGPGGLELAGMASGTFTSLRYLLVFLFLLIWLYRNGRADAPVRRAEVGLETGEGATGLKGYCGVLFVLLAAIAGVYFGWFRGAAHNPTSGQPVTAPGPAPTEWNEPKVTTQALEAGMSPPSWAEDSRLNPRILIVGDQFLMGSPAGAAYNDEQPRRRVRISSFWMQQHEVTNAEFRRFEPKHGFPSGHENVPVVTVTWHQATAYAGWLGGSLPTEAQWEFAARGTRGRKYPWGDQEPTCTRANFNNCGWRPKAVRTHPQGATPQGVEDLAGNVLEWCLDWYADRYPQGDQTDPRGPISGTSRVLRGGSFVGGPGYLRAAYRGYYFPDFAGHDIGFRVVWPATGRLESPLSAHGP